MEKSKQLLKNPRVRGAIIIAIVLLTFGVFGYYLSTHPDVISTLLSLPPALLFLLTIGYLATIAANAYVLHASLKFIGHRVAYSDNVLLTSYSSIINFFGPLQSGPGARAAYLKTKHGVRLRDFFGTTLLFYGFFAIINVCILGTSAILRYPSILTISLAIVVGVCGAVVFFTLRSRSKRFGRALQSLKLTDFNFWKIGIGALGLSIATAGIYFTELHHIAPQISFWQALIYAAAANLSLFVSLTPGAIGFRESFLVISEKLHGIDISTILSANIIDRAFYIVFLAVLFVALLVISRIYKLSFFSHSRK